MKLSISQFLRTATYSRNYVIKDMLDQENSNDLMRKMTLSTNFGLVKIILKQPLMVELSFQNHTILAIDYKMASKIEISQLSLDK